MGHTVLAIPVPAFEDVVRDRTAFYDTSFVSRDPGFIHAHVTVLAPWVSSPSGDDLAVIAEIARSTQPFETWLDTVGEFVDGTIHLKPRPDVDLRRLTARVSAAFPGHPPYGGRFPDAAPHLTLDRRSETITPETVAASIAHVVPVALHVERLDLQWWQNDDCRLLCSWNLGTGRDRP